MAGKEGMALVGEGSQAPPGRLRPASCPGGLVRLGGFAAVKVLAEVGEGVFESAGQAVVGLDELVDGAPVALAFAGGGVAGVADDAGHAGDGLEEGGELLQRVHVAAHFVELEAGREDFRVLLGDGEGFEDEA